MATREEIVAEIQKVPEKHLAELYRIVKGLEEDSETDESGQNVMAVLRRIKIAASRDFSTRANLYDPGAHDAQ
jgi:hypothetical protein